MQIIAHGRNVEIPDHFRAHVTEKLARLERYDGKLISLDVELYHERNPRQTDKCQRVEITCRTRGPVVRAEASAADFYAALDCAVDKLERRLRAAADRRRVHHGRRVPTSVRTIPADAGLADLDGAGVAVADHATLADNDTDADNQQPQEGPGQVVREKEHPATPMTVDQALEQMELVGHDFFLFCDKESGRPSVVYRRHAYDYGLLRLAV